MSKANRNLPHALASYVKRTSRVPSTGVVGHSPYVAMWIRAEDDDPDLSVVSLPGGSLAHYVPKLAHITGLSVGDPVLMQSGLNNTYTIVGIVAGDISIASSSSLEPDDIAPAPPTGVFVDSPTSESLAVHWNLVADTDVAGYDVYFSNGTWARTKRPNTGNATTIHDLNPSTPYSFYIRARDRFGNVSANSAIATGTTAAATLPDPDLTYTKNYPAVWSASYNYQGLGELDTWLPLQANQGKRNGSNTASVIGFDYAKIISEATGGTPIQAWVTLTFAWWHQISGGTAAIGTHASATRPSRLSATVGYSPNLVQSAAWKRGQRRSVALGPSICSGFMSGAVRGVLLGPGPSDNALYGGYAYGASTGIHQPVLTIQFKR